MKRKLNMHIGIERFAARFDDAGLEVSAVERMGELLARIKQADQVDDFYPGYTHGMTKAGKERG